MAAAAVGRRMEDAAARTRMQATTKEAAVFHLIDLKQTHGSKQNDKRGGAKPASTGGSETTVKQYEGCGFAFTSN